MGGVTEATAGAARRRTVHIATITPQTAPEVPLGLTAGECHLRRTGVCSLDLGRARDLQRGDAGFDHCRYLADHLSLWTFIRTRLGEPAPETGEALWEAAHAPAIEEAVRREWRPPFGSDTSTPGVAIERALQLYGAVNAGQAVELVETPGRGPAFNDGRHRACVAGRQRLPFRARVKTLDGAAEWFRERYHEASRAVYDGRYDEALPALRRVIDEGDLEIAVAGARTLGYAHQKRGDWTSALPVLREAVTLALQCDDWSVELGTRSELARACRDHGDDAARVAAVADSLGARGERTRAWGEDQLIDLCSEARDRGDTAFSERVRALVAAAPVRDALREGLTSLLDSPPRRDRGLS